MTEDLTGRRFGMLVVEGPVHHGKKLRWSCLCDCGGRSEIPRQALTTGNSTSCGCRRRSKIRAPFGQDVRLWRIWRNMRQRCTPNPDVPKPNYADRGISVCSEWADYDAFATWANANGYADDLTIDRRDNDGDYSPANCWWTTYREQSRNTRRTVYVEHAGQRITLAQAAADLGINYNQAYHRHVKRGRPFADVLRELQEKPPVSAALRAPGVIDYRSGSDRNETTATDHTYAMMENGDLWPMCGYGWNRSDGTRFSIFRDAPGTVGKCKVCACNVAAGRAPVTEGFPHRTKWL